MSIDLDWNAVTGDDDSSALAESIRAFVDDRFQQIPLPRFIRAVKVHGFDFGQVAPEIEIKDICDPLDDFYEDDDERDEEELGSNVNKLNETGALQGLSNDSHTTEAEDARSERPRQFQSHVHGMTSSPLYGASSGLHARDAAEGARVFQQGSTQHQRHQPPPYIDTRLPGLRSALHPGEQLGSPYGPRSSTPTPGIPGGTSTLNYFHLPLGAGLSGTTTPLAAVAGAHFHRSWPESGAEDGSALHIPSGSESTLPAAPSISSLTPPSTADPSSRPASQHWHEASALSPPPQPRAGLGSNHDEFYAHNHVHGDLGSDSTPPLQTHQNSPRFRERSPQDIQIVARVTYAGNVKLSLTAELILDYPMESFVGISLKLTITGLSFDGVAILAHIRRRAHFCFLSPEDAETLVGSTVGYANDEQSSHSGSASEDQTSRRETKIGGLLKEIHVESEIGDREGGKQVLKNVGKVEKFVLEQVRKIFEDECVYPSFWTFLV